MMDYTKIKNLKDWVFLTSECRAVINYIIEKTNEYNFDKNFKNKAFLHLTKINIILFLFQICYMKKYDKPAFEDEFYAWTSGPVVPGVYFKYHFKYHNLKLQQTKTDVIISHEMKEIIDYILYLTMHMPTNSLMKIVKCELWHSVYNPDDELHEQVISKEEMYNYSKCINPVTEFLECCEQNIVVVDKVKTKIK